VQVQRVRLHAVKLAIRADFRLSLVEIGVSSCLTVELLDVVGGSVEQVAVIGLLIRCRESSKDKDVFV